MSSKLRMHSWGGIAALAGVMTFIVTVVTLHIAAIALAFVLTVLAMYLFPSSAGAAVTAAPRALSWCLAAGVVVSVALSPSVLPMGIGQRLAAACLLAWLAILGWKLKR